mmetsp:Transcript_41222/g.124610  ORF Transcript_41222/g.124610 Transcript_41222/m.124610 type:complete len:177 (-) Transcript_41222:5-535(-)
MGRRGEGTDVRSVVVVVVPRSGAQDFRVRIARGVPVPGGSEVGSDTGEGQSAVRARVSRRSGGEVLRIRTYLLAANVFNVAFMLGFIFLLGSALISLTQVCSWSEEGSLVLRRQIARAITAGCHLWMPRMETCCLYRADLLDGMNNSKRKSLRLSCTCCLLHIHNVLMKIELLPTK